MQKEQMDQQHREGRPLSPPPTNSGHALEGPPHSRRAYLDSILGLAQCQRSSSGSLGGTEGERGAATAGGIEHLKRGKEGGGEVVGRPRMCEEGREEPYAAKKSRAARFVFRCGFAPDKRLKKVASRGLPAGWSC